MTSPTEIWLQAHWYSNIRWMISPIGCNGESIHDRNDSPLVCPEVALTHRFILYGVSRLLLTSGWMLIASEKLQSVTSLERVPRNHRHVPRHPPRWPACLPTVRDPSVKTDWPRGIIHRSHHYCMQCKFATSTLLSVRYEPYYKWCNEM